MAKVRLLRSAPEGAKQLAKTKAVVRTTMEYAEKLKELYGSKHWHYDALQTAWALMKTLPGYDATHSVMSSLKRRLLPPRSNAPSV